uniref:Neprosin PEP catalytic domain-containing protein n=1 Tax=Oryza meridionalis TaxID=40149 RepID=A0A0E0FA78_9ORYZ
MRSLLALFAASILLASTTTTVHGVHIDPNDIIKTIELKPSVDRPKIVEKMMVLGRNNSFKFAEQAWHRSERWWREIKTSKKHAIGAKYDKFSTDDGPAVWWVSLMDEPIGYFHESAFAVPFIESFHNEMGGHVLDRRPGGRHSLTPMGSGMYPSDGLQNAACIHAYLAIAYTGTDQVDDPVNTIVTHPKCYDVKDDGPDLYRPGINVAFGGPEANQKRQPGESRESSIPLVAVVLVGITYIIVRTCAFDGLPPSGRVCFLHLDHMMFDEMPSKRLVKEICVFPLRRHIWDAVFQHGPYNCTIQRRWKKPVDSARTRQEGRTRDHKLDKLMIQLKNLRLALDLHELISQQRNGFASLQLLSRSRCESESPLAITLSAPHSPLP